jgi:hypothetical protein
LYAELDIIDIWYDRSPHIEGVSQIKLEGSAHDERWPKTNKTLFGPVNFSFFI